MEFRASKADLLATLYWTQGIVERRNTMPILANVLIESRKGGIHLTATDLEVGIRGKLEGEVVREGVVTVGAKKIYEIVREARDFPQFPKFEGEKLSSVPAKTLREMIERTIFSVSSDETRYNLNGVFIEEVKDGNVRMVATDGHRLAMIDRGIGALGLAKGVILPRKGLTELRRLLEGADEGLVSVGFKENMGLVVKDDVELFMRLIEGDFPDYTKVIPKDNPQLARLTAADFLHALRRVSLLSSERYKGIKLELKSGKVAITASNPELGEAVEEIEIEYNGKPLVVGFNARYLIDVLTVLGDGGGVEVALKADVSPSILKKNDDAGYLYVIMPMRL